MDQYSKSTPESTPYKNVGQNPVLKRRNKFKFEPSTETGSFNPSPTPESLGLDTSDQFGKATPEQTPFSPAPTEENPGS